MAFLGERFELALVTAHRWHVDQVKKGIGVPYVAHLMGVASLALEFGADEDEAIAALLHDAIEDVPEHGPHPRWTVDQVRLGIEAKFGDRVLAIVEGCTDAFEHPKPAWRGRKERYIARLAQADPSVLFVSACDKLYNARAILVDFRYEGDQVFSRFTGRKAGTLWYYGALVEQYAGLDRGDRVGFTRLVGELSRTVRALRAEAAPDY